MTSTLVTTSDALASEVAHPSPGNGWAYAGVGAGLAGIATIIGSSFAGAVYDPKIQGDSDAIVAKLADQTVPILVMHTGAMVSAVLLLVFAAGLRRFLGERTPARSLLPQVGSSGLLLVSVALLMGSALTTEFAFGIQDPETLVPQTAVFFGHWIGTVPWLWVGAGVTALAVGLAGRRFGAVGAKLAWASLALGGLTTMLGISPLQYMAGMTGPLWLLIAAVALVRRAR